MRALRFLFIVFVLLTTTGGARAQVSLLLSLPQQSGAAGTTFMFAGSLTNTGNSILYLNGDNITLLGIGLTPDDTPFLTNAPLFLAPSGMAGSSYSGPFFSVAADTATNNGSYIGTIDILGGADANAQNVLDMQEFTVNVGPAPVPEGDTCVSLGLLLTMGFGWAMGDTRRRKVSFAKESIFPGLSS